MNFISPPKDLLFIDTRKAFGDDFLKLPYVLRLLLENALRNTNAPLPIIEAFKAWLITRKSDVEITFKPCRIMMHDTTCTPALVDIAAMRDELVKRGLNPALLTPSIPIDVSIDHSTGIEKFGTKSAFTDNLKAEYAKNSERYSFMKWASQKLPNFHVHPPGSGIMHTINVEQLSKLIIVENGITYPEMMLGTDSHTPMINGLGILAWGIGGLEAEGAMFGVPVSLLIPQVVGVKLTGKMPVGCFATDLALTVTQILREINIDNAFVEFFGEGVSSLSVNQRAVVANMAPEYGATTGYFPVDEQALRYFENTGRSSEGIEAYYKAASLWFNSAEEPYYTRVLELDLSKLTPSVAGSKRPQDRLSLSDKKKAGKVVIAAITSCTNTSDPKMLLAAGLLAKKAVLHGLKPPPFVKTSLAPGSPSAQNLLERSGLLPYLEALGFHIAGFGCTTCIGNSGAIIPEFEMEPQKIAVLSGNRNFPSRVHSAIDDSYLMSPPLVVAYALAGRVDFDITTEPLQNGIFLKDIMPTPDEIEEAYEKGHDTSDYKSAFQLAKQRPSWLGLEAQTGEQYAWDEASHYLKPPPFVKAGKRYIHTNPAKALLVLGDDMTTDHISPANQISATSEAGIYLGGKNLNVYAAYRGNFEVMVRGAFTNKAAINQLIPENSAGKTLYKNEIMSLTKAASNYAKDETPLLIFAGERYGMGSSRDWAAKAVALLGVKAIIAKSFERIHRTNLIGMGILPLLLQENIQTDEAFNIDWSFGSLTPNGAFKINNHTLKLAVETSLEIELLRAGGFIPYVLNQKISEA